MGQGEILGIVGESGSGKSVTSMSILRLLPDTARIHPDSSVLFQGQELSKLSLKDLREIRGQKIAMIFQDPMSSLNPLIPVGRQVEEMMRIHHKDLSRAQLRQRALELFQAVRIPEPEKRFVQKMDYPNPRTYVGTGKLEEIRQYVEDNEIGLVIFDDDLSPKQVANIERELKVKILDRTSLILEIGRAHV